MKTIIVLAALISVGAAFGETISAVYETPTTYRIVWSSGSETWKRKDNASTVDEKLAAWFAEGGVAQPQLGPTQSAVKAELRERIEDKALRWLALQKIKDKLVAASKPVLAAQVQARMDQIDADIDTLIAQW